MSNDPIKVLFVCTANYCRSPTAEVIFFDLVEKANLLEHFFIDSAGTHGVFAGSAPDPRAQAMALKRGLRMQHIVSRQITLQDFEYFDYIIGMDQNNIEHLKALCPPRYQSKISLLLSHDATLGTLEVSDPYAGGEQGFAQVFDLISQAAATLLMKIKKTHHL